MNEHSSAARSESPQPTKLIYTRTAAGSVAERIAEHGD